MQCNLVEPVPSQCTSRPLQTMQKQCNLAEPVPSHLLQTMQKQCNLVKPVPSQSQSRPPQIMQKQCNLVEPVPSQSQSHLLQTMQCNLVEPMPSQSTSRPLQTMQKQSLMELVQSQETQSPNQPMVTLFRRRKPAGFYSRLKNNLKPLRRDPLRLLHTRMNPKPSFASLINSFPLKDEELREAKPPKQPGKYCHPLLRDLVWRHDATTRLMGKAIRGFSCDYYATN
ncbi:MAG: uncharacterized protein KVP18_003514 [Porospora cf. gigantea A]|uniref:uncharacterized protein n=1 Tax=Porospora cf. gigantea A TaxID=2853593 RepID=UPI00355A8D11|nr:MAG: hypothetical protein KVP18_003514 [Porospora cf. gigantea A]